MESNLNTGCWVLARSVAAASSAHAVGGFWFEQVKVFAGNSCSELSDVIQVVEDPKCTALSCGDQVAFFENDQLTPVPFAELKTRIEERLAANDKLIVSLKTVRGATYRTFVDVLDELKLAGATKISVANPEDIQ